MRILFLTNNPQTSDSLYEWLSMRGEDMVYKDCPVDGNFVRDNSIEFAISYNYYNIIRKDVIDLLPRRIINLHISLLPYNRGMHPNIWNFIEGTPHGVTIHEIDEGVDTGDILLQEQLVFDPELETLRTSYDKLHKSIQTLFRENWHLIKNGEISPRMQEGAGNVHKKTDLLFLSSVIDYDVTVSSLLLKIENTISQS